jgi:hypothetical protein
LVEEAAGLVEVEEAVAGVEAQDRTGGLGNSATGVNRIRSTACFRSRLTTRR